jgi:hypothetical protein
MIILYLVLGQKSFEFGIAGRKDVDQVNFPERHPR